MAFNWFLGILPLSTSLRGQLGGSRVVTVLAIFGGQTMWLSDAVRINKVIADSVRMLKEMLAGNPSQAP
jgi:hypothetical protein